MSADRFPEAAGAATLNGEPAGEPETPVAGRRYGDREMAEERSGSFRWPVFAAVVAAAGALGVGGFLKARGLPAGEPPPATAADPAGPEASAAVTVKTVHPRRDPKFCMTVEQPAYVEPYYQDDLLARVAGPLKFLDVDIGSRVKAGEVLAVIDAPDLEEDVRQKEAVVVQRQRELQLARALESTAAAQVEFARAVIPEKQSEVTRAEAMQRFRGKELRRFQDLAKGNSPAATGQVVDERTQYYEATVADVQAANAAVDKAKAGLSEAKAKLEAARADVSLKGAFVDVARKDVDRAKAMLSYATIRAPFDGVVTRRNAGPGTFVQNAATARTEPILQVVRTDIVTVYMKVPDNYAPYVAPGTKADIEMGVLPGWKIRAEVTRVAPSLKNPEHDRTMRVEVDLFNGSRQEYDRFRAAAEAANYDGVKGHTLPVFPEVNGRPAPAGPGVRLLPGMFGTMRLELQKFDNAWLVPSTALVSEGGRSFLYLARDGKAVRVPVAVQVDDGRLAKVALDEVVDGREVRHELTGREAVVVSNQGELSDGQAVKAVPSAW
jgi:multidrug resistance efflux pump